MEVSRGRSPLIITGGETREVYGSLCGQTSAVLIIRLCARAATAVISPARSVFLIHLELQITFIFITEYFWNYSIKCLIFKISEKLLLKLKLTSVQN